MLQSNEGVKLVLQSNECSDILLLDCLVSIEKYLVVTKKNWKIFGGHS